MLGFPSNQFLHQENARNQEILNPLKYVGPGSWFEPTLTLFDKCEVNGARRRTPLRLPAGALPAPGDTATAVRTDLRFITWSPVCRNNVAWNLEKFQVAQLVCLCGSTAADSNQQKASLTSKGSGAVPGAQLCLRAPFLSLVLGGHSIALWRFQPRPSEICMS